MSTSALCQTCHRALQAEGRFWCYACRQVLPRAERGKRNACYRCECRRRAVARGTLPPPGYVRLSDACKHLHVCQGALTKRCRKGQIPGAIRMRRYWWIPEEALCR